MNKIKNFLKYNALASLYVCLFIFSQTFALIGVMFYFLATNESFIDLFLEKLGPLYDVADTYSGYIENYDLMLDGYMSLFQEIILPTLLVSNIFIVLVIGIKILRKNKVERSIKKLSFRDTLKFITLGVVLNAGISIVLTLVMLLIPENVQDNLMSSYSMSIESVLNGDVLFLLICSGILAPVAEEFIFRYGMMKNLAKINIKFAIVYQALLFGLLHGNIIQSTYAFVLGLIFGYIDYKEKSIVPSIILHIAINSSSVLISSFFIDEFMGFGVFIGILLILNILIFSFRKKNDNIE